MDDLLACTRCFKCGELEHLAKDCPQNKELTTNPETFFSGMVCNDSFTVHPRNDFRADHFRDNSRAGDSRNDSRARDSRNESRADDDSRNEPSANVDSRNGLCVEGDFQRDDETFLGGRKYDMTSLDVQTDGVALPVPGSSSSFSLGSVVVVGPSENQCRNVKLESGGRAEHSMSEPLVNSPEMKRLMEIPIANGASIRTAYKAARKRLRIEARRQKERDDGVEPEVVLDSFLNQVKVEQHSQSGPLKRVLTPAAKAAKYLHPCLLLSRPFYLMSAQFLPLTLM